MSDGSGAQIIKLPLFAKTEDLLKLPGQSSDASYAIVPALTPKPEENGHGYLVQKMGGRNVRVLAWLGMGGCAYACDAPVSTLPERDPEINFSIDNRDAGTGFVQVCMRPGAGATIVSRFTQRQPDGQLTFVASQCDLGPYGKNYYDLNIALAVTFLSFYWLPSERGESNPWRTAADVLAELRRSSYPDALDALMYQGMAPNGNGSAFERFAARELASAGAERVRTIAAQHSVELRRLASTGLFWTAYDSNDMNEDETDTLQAVEGVLNRLVLMDRALTEDKGSSPSLSVLDEEACRAGSASTLTEFLGAAPKQIRACDEANPFASMRGTTCARGGEWDIRTRFAAAAEHLRVPFNFFYTFDCDARVGVLSVDASIPCERAFPAGELGSTAEAQAAYALRFAALLASVAFGSGVGIVRAVVTIHERMAEGPVLCSFAFSRQMYTMQTVVRIKARELQDASMPPAELLVLLDAPEAHVVFNAAGGLDEVEPVQAGIAERPGSIAEDTRPLPEELRRLYAADTVADLDILDTSDDTLRERFNEVMNRVVDGDTSVAGDLADIVAAYDAADALQGDERRPLYCANMVSRIMAADSLGPATGDVELDRDALRFRKIPDTAYDARHALVRLLRERGNGEDALRLAQELVHLAPATFSAWHALAQVYIDADRLQEATAPLVHSLLTVSVPGDIAVAYYRLGFLYWQTGNAPLGLACYTLVDPRSQFGQAAQEEMNDLMQREHIGRAPTREEAEAMLRAEGVPIAPVKAVCESAVHAAIALVDAGFTRAAEHIVLFLTTLDLGPNSCDVLNAVVRSLR